MSKLRVPFHQPAIGSEEINAVVSTLQSGWVTTGPRTREFEADFRSYVGGEHAVAVNSGTAALHLALEAVGVGDGDEVLVPTMTFAVTAEVVFHLRAKPVLVDCQPDSLNIDTTQIERLVTRRTRAIIPVHMAGLPCDMDPILAIARQHDLRVIDDAAHALPANYRHARIGSLSDITCFSFYATKTVCTGEGGMAVTDNQDWADRMRMMSLHGLSRDAWKRYADGGSWAYAISHPGFKYNLTDIASALGIEQLKKCDEHWTIRQSIAQRYSQAFRDIPAIRVPGCPPDREHAWHLYIIQLDIDHLTIDRSQFISILQELGIGTSVHFVPLHLHPYYRQALDVRPEDFPTASQASERIVSLPIYPTMSEQQVEYVINSVRDTIHRFLA